MDLVDPFYEIGTEYRHMGYPSDIFKLIEFTDTHAVFQRTQGLYLVPKNTRHMFMYRRVKLGESIDIQIN
jgi:hypothetical protein